MPLRTGALTRLDDPPLALAPAAWRFRDRRDAGRRLALLLEHFRTERPIILAMPRGGVPVAAEVARSLGAPLDVAVVRKISAPHNREYAIGAVAEGGVHLLSRSLARTLGLSEGATRSLIADAERELSERTRRYRGTREPVEVAGRTVLLVDDGLATGRSARAAIRSLRDRGAARVILAVPVAAPESVEALRGEADEIVCVEMPDDLWAVGLWYDDFRAPTDAEVTALLSECAPEEAAAAADRDAHGGPRFEPDQPHEVTISAHEEVSLAAEVLVPEEARGMVLFAHGSGSGRRSPRNRAVARALNSSGYATLLFDLLTPGEERARANVFDIPLLASRLVAASAWAAREGALAELPLAYFGASTGAAAALSAAAELGERVHAVISRGGRPDLALGLGAVSAPTLLIVGGADPQVLELNRRAQRQLRCINELAVVPGATHLFEEPGALEQVAHLATEWLDLHLASARATSKLDPMTLRRRREPPAASVHGERLALRDGAEVVIRPIEPGDALQLESGLEHLSAMSRYRRFRAPISHYSPGELDWLTHVDHVRHEALVALEPRGGTIVGIARYVCDPDAQVDAHATYVVDEGWQGRGVGTALIERLAAHARAAGIERWTARMRVGDDTARRLIRRVGAELGERRKAGVVEVTTRL